MAGTIESKAGACTMPILLRWNEQSRRWALAAANVGWAGGGSLRGPCLRAPILILVLAHLQTKQHLPLAWLRLHSNSTTSSLPLRPPFSYQPRAPPRAFPLASRPRWRRRRRWRSTSSPSASPATPGAPTSPVTPSPPPLPRSRSRSFLHMRPSLPILNRRG